MFSVLVEDMYTLIDGFGEHLAGDRKYLDSYAKNDHHKRSRDGRCDSDATFSIKEYHSKDKNGKTYTKKETHYGFREHAVVDTKTELPIYFIVTPANIDEKKMMKQMLKEMKETQLNIKIQRFGIQKVANAFIWTMERMKQRQIKLMKQLDFQNTFEQ